MGVGMGLTIPSFLIAVQSTVQRRWLGTAASTLQFSRSMGGVLGVSIMGVFLSQRLAQGLTAAGIDPASVSLDSLLDPLANAGSTSTFDSALRVALAGAIQGVFLLALVSAALALVVTALAPGGRIAQLAARQSQAEAERRAPGEPEPAPQPVALE
jgi:hypothetical protein